MSAKTVIAGLLLLGMFLSGCAGSKDPVGPDTGIPPFDISANPPIIASTQNAALSLTQTLPLEFQELDNRLILFSCSPENGLFSPYNYSTIDIAASGTGYLNPQIWFQFVGTAPQGTLAVTVYAHVISQLGDTLAWNSCLIDVVSN